MVFQRKNYKREVLGIVILLLFHPKNSFLQHKNMFNLDAITNKNSKDNNKNWPYRMLMTGPSGSGKTNALLSLIQYQDNDLIDKICMLKA